MKVRKNITSPYGCRGLKEVKSANPVTNFKNDIKRIKAKLSKKQPYENFGQKEIRELRDKYASYWYDIEYREMWDLIQELEDWCSTYTGFRESVNPYHTLKESQLSDDEIRNLFDKFMRDTRSYDEIDGDMYVVKLYADYNDWLDERTVIKALETNYPTEYLENLIDEGFNYGGTYWNDLVYRFEEWLSGHFEDYDEDEVDAVALDIVEERVFFDIDFNHYFKQRMTSVLTVDTGDADYDFTLNPNDMSSDEEINDLEDEASLVWLAKTQGYSKEQLIEAINKGNYGNSKFLKSVAQEIYNMPSTISALTFLLDATVEDLCEVKENSDNVKVGTSVVCGLYDSWNGGGSLFEIELEKPITIPNKYIHSFLPDTDKGGYSVRSTYGVGSDFYSRDYSIV